MRVLLAFVLLAGCADPGRAVMLSAATPPALTAANPAFDKAVHCVWQIKSQTLRGHRPLTNGSYMFSFGARTATGDTNSVIVINPDGKSPGTSFGSPRERWLPADYRLAKDLGACLGTAAV